MHFILLFLSVFSFAIQGYASSETSENFENEIEISLKDLRNVDKIMLRAICSGNLELIQHLVRDYKPNLKIIHNGQSLGEIAAKLGHVEILRFFYTHGDPHVDEFFVSAFEYYAQAEENRSKLENPEQHFIGFDKNKPEAVSLNLFIKNILQSKLKSETLTLLLLQAFSRILQLRANPVACMLCFDHENVKIAKSHFVSHGILKFVSKNWICPSSNNVIGSEKMTLSLLCEGKKSDGKKAKEKSRMYCEQILSSKGESEFITKFLPFIKDVKEKWLKRSGSFRIDYGTYLFHCISSLAYRVFLSDLEKHENWANYAHRDLRFSGGVKSQIEFFMNLNKYILGNENAPSYQIRLYLSEDGLVGNEDKEHPILHFLKSYYSHIEQEWTHTVLFSISGFHFLILSKEPNESIEELLKQDEGEFQSLIHPQGGSLNIELGHKAVLPHVLQKSVQDRMERIRQEFGSSNFLAHSSEIHEKRTDEGNPLMDPLLRVHLPDYLSYKPNRHNGVWEPGKIATSNDHVNLLSFHREDDSQMAVWIFEHSMRKILFAIIEIYQSPHTIVLGYEFKLADFELPEISKRMHTNNFENLLTVLKDTQHFGIQFQNPEDIVAMISIALMKEKLVKPVDHKLLNINPSFDFEEEEVLANTASIQDIDQVLVGGRVKKCRFQSMPADGNCGFSSLGITREDYIQRVRAAYLSNSDADLMLWIFDAMEQLGVDTIEEWAREFRNTSHWMDLTHMNIASRIYNLRIRFFVVAPLDTHGGRSNGAIFIPVEGDQHLIDNSNGNSSREVNVVWRTLRPMTTTGVHELIHFDRIDIQEDDYRMAAILLLVLYASQNMKL